MSAQKVKKTKKKNFDMREFPLLDPEYSILIKNYQIEDTILKGLKNELRQCPRPRIAEISCTLLHPEKLKVEIPLPFDAQTQEEVDATIKRKFQKMSTIALRNFNSNPVPISCAGNATDYMGEGRLKIDGMQIRKTRSISYTHYERVFSPALRYVAKHPECVMVWNETPGYAADRISIMESKDRMTSYVNGFGSFEMRKLLLRNMIEDCTLEMDDELWSNLLSLGMPPKTRYYRLTRIGQLVAACDVQEDKLRDIVEALNSGASIEFKSEWNSVAKTYRTCYSSLKEDNPRRMAYAALLNVTIKDKI